MSRLRPDFLILFSSLERSLQLSKKKKRSLQLSQLHERHPRNYLDHSPLCQPRRARQLSEVIDDPVNYTLHLDKTFACQLNRIAGCHSQRSIGWSQHQLRLHLTCRALGVHTAVPRTAQVMSPSCSTRPLLQTVTRDTTPIDDPDHDGISDFSKTTRESTGLFGVPTVFEASVSQVSHGDSALQRESKERMPRETVARQREWGGKRRFCDQWYRVDGTVLGVLLFRLIENSILMSEISENTSNEELNKLFLVKIQFREDETRLSTTWRSTILERRNSEYALFESQRELESQRLQLLEANQWADQAQRERIHLCSEVEMKNRLHQESNARSCREIEDLKRHCCQEENTEKQQRLEEFPTQHDQESRTVSLLRDQVRRLQERLEFIEDSKILRSSSSPYHLEALKA